MTLTALHEFAGAGGDAQGVACVPGVEPIFAANHNQQAIESHAANFPHADHYCNDITKADLARFPRADIFWASPGNKRDRVRQYGAAVTPPAAEIIVAALAEAITGEDPYEAGAA